MTVPLTGVTSRPSAVQPLPLAGTRLGVATGAGWLAAGGAGADPPSVFPAGESGAAPVPGSAVPGSVSASSSPSAARSSTFAPPTGRSMSANTTFTSSPSEAAVAVAVS